MSANNFQSAFYIFGCLMFCSIAFFYCKIINKLYDHIGKMREVYISLNEEDFDCLVRGGKLSVCHVRTGQMTYIILQDIGFLRMDLAVNYAEKGENIRKDHFKLANA